MKKSAIYVRVSTYHQIDKDSLPLQKKDMINYSKLVLGIDDYEIFEDAGFSAKNTDRPAFQQMIKRVKQGEFSHLLVWKIDRISRNLLDFCSMYDELKEHGCIFVSKNEQFDTSSAMGEAMLKIILVFAELERKMTGERVTSVMLDRASKGLWNGAPIPLGYKWDDKIKFPIIDDEEKRTIEIIFNEYKEQESTSYIRNLLNANNIKTKRNGPWTTKTVSDIIRNPFYKGTYRYNYRETARGKKKKENEWILLEDNHQAIISKELWNECNNIMDENAKRNNSKFRDNSKVHIFAGLIECGECHNNLYAKQDKANLDGFRPSLYVCKSRYNGLGCTQKTISENIIGTFVLTFISNMINLANINKKMLSINLLEHELLKDKCFENIIGIKEIDDIMTSILYAPKNLFTPQKKNEKHTHTLIDLDSLSSNLKKQQRALEKLEDLYLYDDADMSKKDYLLKKRTIEDKITEITKKIDETSTTDSSAYSFNFILDAATLEFSKRLLQNGNINMKSLIQSVGRDIIKEFVNTLIYKIILLNKEIKSIEFKNGLKLTFVYNS